MNLTQYSKIWGSHVTSFKPKRKLKTCLRCDIDFIVRNVYIRQKLFNKQRIVPLFFCSFCDNAYVLLLIQLQFKFDFVVPTHCSEDAIPCASSKKLLSVDEEFTKVWKLINQKCLYFNLLRARFKKSLCLKCFIWICNGIVNICSILSL